MNHAHEVGHLVIRAAPEVDEECVAKRFAGAFLLPAAAVRDEFGVRRNRITADELLLAKSRWGISVQGALRRLVDLGVLGEASYKWWCIHINQVGWRTDEPGTVNAIEAPALLNAALTAGKLTASDVARETGWSEGRVTELITESTDNRPPVHF